MSDIVKVSKDVCINLDQLLFTKRKTQYVQGSAGSYEVVTFFFATGGAGGNTYNHGIIDFDVAVSDLTDWAKDKF